MGAIALVSRGANAAPARVAVVHSSNPDALEQRTLTRLRAELAAAGFEVSDMARGADDPREAAEAEPPVAGVFATIAIVPRTADAADIWVADRITGKTVVRRVQGGAGTGGDVAAILAVRAVELLQASLLEAFEPRPREQERATSAPMPGAVSAWMSDRSRREATFSVDAGVGVLHSMGGVGPAALPILGLSYRATPALALRLRVGGPAFAADLKMPSGRIAVHQETILLDAVFRARGGAAWVRPIALVGAGAYRLDVAGTAVPPYQGRTGGLVGAVIDAGFGAALRLSSRASLLADARALLVMPKLVVRADGEEAGSIGRATLLGELSVDVAF
jgi:hypothetical protein